jgi:hypothetical protein
MVCCASDAAGVVIIHYYLVAQQAVWPQGILFFFSTKLASAHLHNLDNGFGFSVQRKTKDW